ncbi:hypothetical protein BCR43DRAFT_412819, partial [Syncephalastrum racemosum]
VKQLLLRRKRLTELGRFAKLIRTLRHQLMEISLRENLLSSIPNEIKILRNLTTLSLASNHIHTLQTDVFPNLPNLQWLVLSGNQISALPHDLVACRRLKGLDLQHNQFTEIPLLVYHLPCLSLLMLQNNRITDVPLRDFPETLTALNLSFNQLTDIPDGLIFRPPPALEHLYLSGNPITEIPPDFITHGYGRLISLDLHTCQLKHVPSAFLDSLATRCPRLVRLNLAINHITALPDSIGRCATLQWLNLNDNRLTELPPTLANLERLVKLGLVKNELETLPPRMLCRMRQLRKLDVRRNRLRYMPPSLLSVLTAQERSGAPETAVPWSVFSDSACPPSCA